MRLGTHAGVPYTLTPFIYVCWEGSCTLTSITGNEPRQRDFLPFDRSTLPDFSDKGGKKKKKSERMHTQGTYLTQKYKTTGPDFLGKSCSKTLRSS